MKLSWYDYPGISYYKRGEFDIMEIESPGINEVVSAVEGMKDNRVLVLKNCGFLPDDSKSYRKHGPELKIPPENASPWNHFSKHFKRIKKNRPKRCYQWPNESNRTRVQVPFSSILDGYKFYMSRPEFSDISLYSGGKGRVIESEIISRKGRKYPIFQTAVTGDKPDSWRFYNCDCGCEGHLFGKYTETKYVNPVNEVCLHQVGLYNAAMKKHKELRPLFPGPTGKLIHFDENLTRVYLQRGYKGRLTIAHRNILDSSYIGLLNERDERALSFFSNDYFRAYKDLSE